MNIRNSAPIVTALCLGSLGLAAFGQTSQTTAPSTAKAAPSTRAAVNYGKLPLSFEPNLGQTSPLVQFLARGPQYTLYLAGDDAVLRINKIVPGASAASDPAKLRPTVTSSAVRMSLLGARPSASTTAEDPQPGKANYFTGNDPAKWQHDVPMYGKVHMLGVYPGVDLVYYGRQGALEYDFVVAAGADASAIRVSFDGAKPALAANGDLVLPVTGGPEVRFNKPVVYQVKDGVRQPIDGSFAIADNKDGEQVSFRLGAYDHTRELVIDPTLLFVGVLGTGNYETQAAGMAVDASGEIILTGATSDVDFPVTSGAYQTTCNQDSTVAAANHLVRCGGFSEGYLGSAFITKISADGTSLVYSTYLHGFSGSEAGQAVAADAAGDAIVLGQTGSSDFPITADAFQSLCMPWYQEKGVVGGDPSDFYPIAQHCDGYFSGGGTEWVSGGPTLFIAKLDPTGATLLYSTFFGGTNATYPSDLALDSSGNIYFTSFLNGAEENMQNGLPVNNVYPQSGTVPFPYTASSFQSLSPAQQVTTLSVLSADGHSLLYSTLFGAEYSVPGLNFVQPLTLALGPNGIAYVGGMTSSDAVPTTAGAVRQACVDSTVYYGPPENGSCVGQTGWLAAFDTTKSGTASLKYATYIGGPEVPGPNSARNQVWGLAADSDNDVYVTGLTVSPTYPTTPGAYSSTCTNYRAAYGCNNTAFLTKINPSGSAYVWSTYFGGNNDSQSQGQAIGFDAKGRVYLYGFDNDYTYDLPFLNPLETNPGTGASYAFVATFTPDGSKLVFATPLENQSPTGADVYPVPNNGMVLDAEGNIYFSAYGQDNGTFITTPGAYATAALGAGPRTYFGKISPVRDPTATTLTVSPSTIIAGQTVTFTASVAGTAVTTPTPTGTVTLFNNSTDVATKLGTITLGTNGSGKFTTSSLAAGQYSVTATYSGDTNYEVNTSTPQSLTVNPTVAAVLNSPQPGSLLQGPSATFGWSKGTGVTAYMLRLGTTGAGSSNVFASAAISAQSVAVTGLPIAGKTLYARLSSEIYGVWTHNDSIYAEASLPQVSLSSTSLAFGSVKVGAASGSQSVTMKNTGGAALAITNIGVTGADASSFGFGDNCGTSLAAGAECAIHGHFAPTTTGALTAAVTISDNAGNSPQSIALSGAGVEVPVVSLSATSLSFGSVKVGTASASQSVTLTNTGNGALSIAGIGLKGADTSSFVFANSCGSTLAAGAKCTIHGHFMPAAKGALSASIVLTDNAGGSPQSIALSGAGQ